MSEQMRLFCWAANHHYPQLVPAKGLVIHAGSQAWLHFLREATDEAMEAVRVRCELWDEVASGKTLAKR